MNPLSILSRSATLLLAVGLAGALPGQAIQLANGRVLVGEIQQVHGEGLTFVRVDNGGVLQLRWEHLAAESASTVKKMFDISVEDEGELLVDADVITFRTPSGRAETHTGRIVAEDGERLTLRTRTGDLQIARRSIRDLRRQQLPALQVYTKDEFYQEQLARMAPGDDADRHILFADVLVRIGDYERAEQHLQRADELGNSKQPTALRAKLQKVALYKSVADERALLDQIKVARARRDFHRGTELIAQFEQSFPDSKLNGELSQEKERFAAARERFFVARVVENWYLQIHQIAKKKLLDTSIGLAAARDFAERDMGQEIRRAVANIQRLEPAEIEELWGKRFDYSGVPKTQTFTYGVGSWVLGEARILADTKQGDAESDADKNQAKDAKDARLERKIKEFLDRSRKAQAAGQKQEEETDEDWWRAAGPGDRLLFLKAYYAENGGDLRVQSAHLAPCLACAAQGYLESVGQTGKPQKDKCFLCKGTRFRRLLRAQ